MKFIHKQSLIPCIIVSFLVGCATTELPKDNSAYAVLARSQEAPSMIQNKWWHAYQDENLNKLIEYALSHNSDLAKSALTMQKAMYQANLKQLDIYPTLAGGLGASTNRDLYQKDSFSDHRSFNGEMSLNYEVDLWNRLGDLKDAAAYEFKASYFDKENTRLTLINSVIDVYFNLVYLNSVVASLDDSLANHRKIETIMRDKLKSGQISPLELLQATQAVKETQNQRLSYKTQMKDNEQLLKNLLNISSFNGMNLKYPSLLSVKSVKINLNQPIDILVARPDVQASEFRVRKAYRSFEAEKKSFYPSITIQSVLSSNNKNIGSTFSSSAILGSISINLPFLDWNRIKTNVNISKVEYEQAYLDLEKSMNTAINEVAYYYSAYTTSKSALNTSKSKYRDSISISQIYFSQYQAGQSEFKDYLESQNTAQNAKLTILSDQYQLIKYENMLIKSMAGKI